MEFLGNLINVTWVVDLLYKICLFIDWCIYSVASWFFNAFYQIAQMDITGSFAHLEIILDRIKLFIGIFILFILVKTIVTSLANPENVIGGSKKIVINIFVSIALLISSTFIFDLLNDFQRSIMDYNTIPSLVLGPEVGDAFANNDDVGKVYVNNIFTAFFYCSGNDGADCDPSTRLTILNVKTGAQSILDLQNVTDKKGVHYEFPIVSGIVGVVLCYYFILFAVALGIRLFKLLILQVLAPIPIIAYIDPNKKDFCSKYVKLFLNTYLELFVRLFSILLVYSLTATLIQDISVSGEDKSFLVTLLLVIALLQFAKQFPKLISDILGIDTSLSSLKGVGGMIGGMLGLGAGVGVGLTAGIASGATNRLKFGDFMAHSLTSAAKGGFAGAKGGSKGIGGFVSGMAGSVTGDVVAANQIWHSGGYGNYVKGNLLNKFGYSKFAEDKRERLSDAVTNASQRKEKLEGYKGQLDSFQSAVQGAYDKRTGGLEGKYEYQQALAERKKAIESDDKVGFQAANEKIMATEAEYKRGLSDFYNNQISSTSTDPEIVTLAGMREKITAELKDADTNINLTTYEGIDASKGRLDAGITDADATLDAAEKELKTFKDTSMYQQVTYDKDKGNKYRSSSGSSSGPSGPSSSSSSSSSSATSSSSSSSSTGPSASAPTPSVPTHINSRGERETSSGIILDTTESAFKSARDDAKNNRK